jgi:hypothetical protein
MLGCALLALTSSVTRDSHVRERERERVRVREREREKERESQLDWAAKEISCPDMTREGVRVTLT